jgi:hypothetical protein
MIQRIQTLLLAASVLIMGILLFMPIGTIYTALGADNVSLSYRYMPFFVREAIPEGQIVFSCAYVGILILISALLSLYTIFLYKDRMKQIRWTTIAMYVYIITLVLMIYFFPDFIFKKKFGAGTTFAYNKWIMASLIPALLLFIAKKFIIRDEKRVQAADRLR